MPQTTGERLGRIEERMQSVEESVHEIPNLIRVQDNIVFELKSMKRILLAIMVTPVVLFLTVIGKIKGPELLGFFMRFFQ